MNLKFKHCALIILFGLFGANNSSSAQEALFRTNALKIRKAEVEKMLKKNNFYCATLNPEGAGLKNDFVMQKDSLVVYDRASGLYWQRSKSSTSIHPVYANDYSKRLNLTKFAGFNDWRLPTLEEAMSLVFREDSGRSTFYQYFRESGESIWTADTDELDGYWYVDFHYQKCQVHPVTGVYFNNIFYVRAVRSDLQNIQQPPKKEIKISGGKAEKMSLKDVEHMLKENNLFDSQLNSVGEGVENELDVKLIGINMLVVDKSLGLMWYQPFFKNYTYSEAEAAAKRCNDREMVGFNNWRLPKLNEVMRLVIKDKNKNGEHLCGGLCLNGIRPKAVNTWTCDTSENGKKYWIVDFEKGTCLLQSGKRKNNVLMVRNIKE